MAVAGRPAVGRRGAETFSEESPRPQGCGVRAASVSCPRLVRRPRAVKSLNGESFAKWRGVAGGGNEKQKSIAVSVTA